MEAHVTLNGILARVREATLELHHFESNEADWNLVVQLDGDLPELRMSGTVVTPTEPGLAQLRIAFIDEPRSVIVDGATGGLTNGGHDIFFAAMLNGERARLEGQVELEWCGVAWGSRSQRVVLSLDLEAAVKRVA